MTIKQKSNRKALSWVIAILMVITTLMPYSNVFGAETAQVNTGVTETKTPGDSKEASLKWAAKFGTGWSASPTPALIIGDKVYIGVADELLELNKEDGSLIRKSSKLAGTVGYSMHPPIYADGKIFIQVGKGKIQAIDKETLEPVWSTESVGDKQQTVSPLVYKNIDGKGYIFTGSWQTGQNGYFFGFTTDNDNVSNKVKPLAWKFQPTGVDTDAKSDPTLVGSNEKIGFYWAGAYVTDKYVAVGSDATKNGKGSLYILNPKTGAIIAKDNEINGNIRTTIKYHNGYLYFGNQGGEIVKYSISSEGAIFNKSAVKVGKAVTAPPVIYKDRLYVGFMGNGGQFSPDAGHGIAVVDVSEPTLSNSSLIYTATVAGYPQNQVLLSTARENEDFDGDGKPDGKVFVYTTYNAQPGGIVYLTDKPGQTAPSEVKPLYTPEASKQQYCISPILADSDGVMYYKNDSGHTFAVKLNPDKYVAGLTLSDMEKEILKGQTFTLTATVAPENTTEKGVTYTSEDETIATVDENGVVTGVAEGTTTITVKTDSMDYVRKCKVTVLSIDKIKENGKTQVSTYKNKNDYRAEDAKKIDEIITEANKQISNATSKEEVKNAVDSAKAKLDDLKTDASKTDEEVADAIAKINAIGDVTDKSGNAISEARKAYDKVPENAKTRVTNKDKLVESEKKFKEITTRIVTDKVIAIKKGESAKISVIDSTGPITWQLENTDSKIATVDQSGKVTGNTVGSAIIQAKVGDKTSETLVVVYDVNRGTHLDKQMKDIIEKAVKGEKIEGISESLKKEIAKAATSGDRLSIESKVEKVSSPLDSGVATSIDKLMEELGPKWSKGDSIIYSVLIKKNDAQIGTVSKLNEFTDIEILGKTGIDKAKMYRVVKTFKNSDGKIESTTVFPKQDGEKLVINSNETGVFTIISRDLEKGDNGGKTDNNQNINKGQQGSKENKAGNNAKAGKITKNVQKGNKVVTGDEMNIGLLVGIFALAVIVGGVVLILSRKKQKK